ncbi:MAG: glycosyltransferase family 9 protein, partial [Vulcanimicrobiota bacterium]
VICSLPLIKSIKENWPDRTIHAITLPKNRPLVMATEAVEEVKMLDEKAGLMERFKFLQSLEEDRYDLVLCVTPTITGYLAAYLTKAAHKLGIVFNKQPYIAPIANFLLTESLEFDLNQSKIPHQIDMNLSFLKKLGMQEVNKDIDLSFPQDDDKFAFTVLRQKGWETRNARIFFINVSKKWLFKEWDKPNFIKLTAEIKKAFPDSYILYIYEDWQIDIGRELEAHYKSEKSVQCVQVRELFRILALIRRCKYVITVDPAYVMMASSQKVPVIALYSEDEYDELSQRWGPWKVKNRRFPQRAPSQIQKDILGSIIELEKLY